MGSVLVDYACPACGSFVEHRVAAPPPGELPCAQCGAPAKRRFGFRVGSLSETRRAAAPNADAHDHPHGLGTCGLLPTAARALTARLSGDERALDREFRAQQRMISEGTLDPAGGPRGLSAPPAAEAAASAA